MFASSITVYYPVSDPMFQLAGLFTSRYPGHVILLGERKVALATCFDALAARGFHIYADAPDAFACLLPDAAKPLDRQNLKELTAPFLAWVHLAGDWSDAFWAQVAAVARETPVACISLGQRNGRGSAGRNRPVMGTAAFSIPFSGRTICSALDIIPTLAPALSVPMSAGDGHDLAWLDRETVSAFFAEDWRGGFMSVSQDQSRLVCLMDPLTLPAGLVRLCRLFGRGRKARRRRITLWDAKGYVQAASRFRLHPVAHTVLDTGQRKSDARERKHLMGLLEAHLARYSHSPDDAVMNRLQDLGYV